MNAAATSGTVQGVPTVPAEVHETLARFQRPVLIAHVVPDADALGAMFALARTGWDAACRPRVCLPAGSLSQRLAFLFDLAQVKVASVSAFADADGFVVLDTAKMPRCNLEPGLKETDWSAGRPVLNLDHHTTNTEFGDVNWVVSTAGSTCELVYYLLRAAGRSLDPVTASLLFAGIYTDTVGFSLPTTSAETLETAAALVRAGADVALLGERLCRSQDRSEFDLLRTIYQNTKVNADGRLAYSTASYEEIHDAGCTPSDIDEQVNIVRALRGVQLALLFTEGNRGKTRINFRGEGDVTVLDLAREFNGGGHQQAAGAVLDGGLEDSMSQVLPRAEEYLKQFAG